MSQDPHAEQVIAALHTEAPEGEESLGFAEVKKLRDVMVYREQKYRNSFSQRAVVELALFSGAKVHELVKLSCGDLFLVPGAASLRLASESFPRVLPLIIEQQEYFSGFLKKKEEVGESVHKTAPLVCSQAGDRLTLRGWQSAWSLACRHTGLVDQNQKPLYNFESVRRTVGRHLYGLKKNPHHVQAWLGLDITSNADRYRPGILDFGFDALRNLVTEGEQPTDLLHFHHPTLELAMGYYTGTLGIMNRTLAKRLFLDLSLQDPRREMFVARCLTSGRCQFPVDETRGIKKAKRAISAVEEMADAGDPFSIYLLASACDEGLAVAQDYERSHELYKKAAALGEEMAINNLGLQCFFGKGVERDDEKAFQLFTQAASLHVATSMFNLAFLYQEGLGTDRDEQMAFRWLTKGALTGEARSMNNLSYYYSNGIATLKDDAMAERWYCMAGSVSPQSKGMSVSRRTLELIRLAG